MKARLGDRSSIISIIPFLTCFSASCFSALAAQEAGDWRWFPEPVLIDILLGQAIFPPVVYGDDIFFPADDRRLYHLNGSDFDSVQFDRRIIDPLFQREGSSSILRLSDGSGYLIGERGILTRRLSPDEILSRFPASDSPEFILSPGGIRVSGTGGITGYAASGSEVFRLIPASGSAIRTAEAIGSCDILFMRVSGGSEQQFVLHFFPANLRTRFGGANHMQEFVFESEEYQGLDYRVDPVPEHRSGERLLGVLRPRSSGEPDFLFLDAATQTLVLRAGGGDPLYTDFRLTDFGSDLAFCVLSDSGYIVCSWLRWGIGVFKLDSARWDFDAPQRLLGHLRSAISSMRGVQNAYTEQILQDPDGFERFLENVGRSMNPGRMLSVNALYRILFYPVHTGEFIDQRLRLSALDVLRDAELSSIAVPVFLEMLRYEYDPVIALALVEWAFVRHPAELAERAAVAGRAFVTLAGRMQIQDIRTAVELYRRIREFYIPAVNEEMFPDRFWEALLSSRVISAETRSLILGR